MYYSPILCPQLWVRWIKLMGRFSNFLFLFLKVKFRGCFFLFQYRINICIFNNTAKITIPAKTWIFWVQKSKTGLAYFYSYCGSVHFVVSNLPQTPFPSLIIGRWPLMWSHRILWLSPHWTLDRGQVDIGHKGDMWTGGHCPVTGWTLGPGDLDS